ncbi:uncharacterized protein [Periplaneta americana]|uniref:uncharacterized protein n=1 Tax=Periplaneta americana TaxID=6978 RepID=UPI0037E7A879
MDSSFSDPDAMRNNIQSMKVADLKAELKKRGGKTSGNKRELLERLEAYMKLHIQKTSVSLALTGRPTLDFPEVLDGFQDIVSAHRSEIKLSSFELINYFIFRKSEINGCSVSNYRSLCDSGYRLFNDRFINFIKCYVNSSAVFIISQVKSEYTKNKKYEVKLVLNKSSIISGADCECVAGAGPKASCKHIAALCYALEHFSKSGEIKCSQTCTQVLQTFHRPANKKRTQSPIKAKDLPLAPDAQMPCHDVRPLSGINQEGYENYVHKLIQSSTHKLTFSYAVKKESVPLIGVVHDHYYGVDPLTTFAETLVATDEEKRAQVEKTKREQSQQHLWFKERECRLTASNFGKICRTRDPEKLARQLRMRSNFQNNNMKWGLQMEGLARMRFEEITDNRVVRCGLIIHPEKSYLVASCDGLIGNEGVLELKGLSSQKNYKISVNAVPYLQMIGRNVVLKRNHNYFYQVQGQL